MPERAAAPLIFIAVLDIVPHWKYNLLMIYWKWSGNMKKALKIMIPILLALVVLGSVVWYLLDYDPAFTKDILLKQARYQENKGNHTISAWLYDLAYNQSSQDASVAIELAEQYKSIGNYTKAEYTLSNAISNGGTADLYAALCRTYVEQDKLLDAVTMLDRISDPAIQAELDALRPEAPVADYEPGFYTQYISVSLQAASGTLYDNINEFPTLQKPAYSEPITLPAGETTIYALAVGENGLVSKLSIFGYTVGGVVEKVTFTDEAMETAVRACLSVSADKQLFTNDLWTITEFEVPEDAVSLEALSLMTYLTKLTIHGSDADLSVVSSLNHLEELDLTGCKPTGELLAALAQFPALQKLTLADCGLSSIADLSGASHLVSLNLNNNTVRNIEAISTMTSLQELSMQHNALTGLDTLSGLANLKKLDVSYNVLTSLEPLGNCSALTWLNASNNSISSLKGVDRLSGLDYLDASYNKLSDVTPLSGSVKLTQLNLSNNTLTDISALSNLNSLSVFDFSYNEVAALPAWSSSCELVTINGSYNQLETIDGLAGFRKLNNVFMDYNKLTSVDALSACPLLIQVNVYGNEISDVSALTDMSVIVNYTPITTAG